MVKTLIAAFPAIKKEAQKDNSAVLNISENFCDTVQGENWSGYPSVFLRLQHCTLNCIFCDTTEVWRKGNPYSVTELLDLWEKEGVVERFKNRHHLVITGGSPLLQMSSIESLILEFKTRFLFKPFIEVENECMIHPSLYMFKIVDRWNNSPKLANSGMKFEIRYRPDIIRKMSCIPRSDFKFVISSSEDWGEIQRDYLDEDLISKSQIVLMPEGSTREQLQKNYDKVVELCCEQGVRMCDRMQVTIFDKSVGV